MEMNKQFFYKGFNFNIKVVTDFKQDRHVGGKRWHLISLNDMGATNYLKLREVESSEAIDVHVNGMIVDAKLYVDKTLDKTVGYTATQKKLFEMGFKE